MSFTIVLYRYICVISILFLKMLLFDIDTSLPFLTFLLLCHCFFLSFSLSFSLSFFLSFFLPFFLLLFHFFFLLSFFLPFFLSFFLSSFLPPFFPSTLSLFLPSFFYSSFSLSFFPFLMILFSLPPYHIQAQKGREPPGFLNSQIFYSEIVSHVDKWRSPVEVSEVYR
jgi:hypothetical protein